MNPTQPSTGSNQPPSPSPSGAPPTPSAPSDPKSSTPNPTPPAIPKSNHSMTSEAATKQDENKEQLSTTPLTPLKSETEKAYNAFLKYLELGPGTTIAALVKATGISEGTVKFWSSRFHWRDRAKWINAQAIQKRVEEQTRLQIAAAADWARRFQEQLELEWKGGNELMAATRQMLSTLVAPPENLSLGQLATAMQAGAKMSRQAVERATAKSEGQAADTDALRQQLLAHAKKVYGKQTLAPAPSPTPAPQSGKPLQKS